MACEILHETAATPQEILRHGPTPPRRGRTGGRVFGAPQPREPDFRRPKPWRAVPKLDEDLRRRGGAARRGVSGTSEPARRERPDPRSQIAETLTARARKRQGHDALDAAARTTLGRSIPQQIKEMSDAQPAIIRDFSLEQ